MFVLRPKHFYSELISTKRQIRVFNIYRKRQKQKTALVMSNMGFT